MGDFGIAYENMSTLVIKHVRSRIVADSTDFYDECEPVIKLYLSLIDASMHLFIRTLVFFQPIGTFFIN